MQHAFAVIFIIAYTIGLIHLGGAASSANVVTVKLVHSHATGHQEHEDHHHNEDENQVPHAHDVSIPGFALYVLTFPGSVDNPQVMTKHYPDPIETSPPRAPGLDAIFKPPIS